MGAQQNVSVFLLTLSGVANTVLNKYLVSKLRVRAKFLVLSVQTGIVLILLLLANLFVLQLPLSVPSGYIGEWACAAVSLVVMIYSGLEANEYLPISLFTILKNGSIPIVAVYDTFFSCYALSTPTVISFFLVLTSSVLGSAADMRKKQGLESAGVHRLQKRVTATGASWMLTNCISSAAYAIRINRAMSKHTTRVLLASVYVNALALPLLVVLCILEGIPNRVPKGAPALIALSGVTSCLISTSSFWAASLFTATSMSMIAALNKGPMALSGMVFGLEPAGDPMKWASVGLGAAAAILFAASRSKR